MTSGKEHDRFRTEMAELQTKFRFMIILMGAILTLLLVSR